MLAELFKPHRYKVLWGGRGGMKSWSIARALVLICVQKPTRVLCVREQMNSIKDSVHKLLSDQIMLLGLSHLFDIQQATIKCIAGPGAGSEFNFEGIRHNITKVKSYEGIDICWPEEAVNVSKTSWQVLIPTIRKPGSEIWISFNPDLESDETYKRFVKNPPPGAWVQKVNYYDNPWLPQELKDEAEYLKEHDYDTYLHVYEGHCKTVLEGAVYASELRATQKEGRFTKVPYDPTVAVHTVWDLGWSDATAIWFVQKVGLSWHFINYRESVLTKLADDLLFCQQQGYIYDTFWLPHDARAKSKGTGLSIQDLVRNAGHHCRIVPKLSLKDGINASRTIFGRCYFDEDKCADGIQALRHYRYEVVEDPIKAIFTKEPVHDWTSHAADAFRYAAIAMHQSKRDSSRVLAALNGPKYQEDEQLLDVARFRTNLNGRNTGWMS